MKRKQAEQISKKINGQTPLDFNSFNQIRDIEFIPSHRLTDLKYLRERAKYERDIRELYKGRAPYELLQNADDTGAHKATFILTIDGLIFAHDGQWFTVSNFRSLADGWSDKDPNQCIGHKGLGFRSVLEITPSPQLIKIQHGQFFGVKFTWAINNNHIQHTLNLHPEFREQYTEWTSQGQNCCPIMAIPGFLKKQSLGYGILTFNSLLQGSYGSDYTTMFYFPAKDPDIDKKVLSELGPEPIIANEQGRERLIKFMFKEVSAILPFLKSIKRVSIYQNDKLISYAIIPPRMTRQKQEEISVKVKTANNEYNRFFFRKDFLLNIPPHIKQQPDTPRAIKTMEKANISILVKLENGQPVPDNDAMFHVYFPTTEPTGTGFIVHGDFYVKPDRTRLMESTYNEWLLNNAANFVSNEVLTSLLDKYRVKAVFPTLAPFDYGQAWASQTYRTSFTKSLRNREEPFIPTKQGLVTREVAVLPPIIDNEGFWEGHFGDVIQAFLPEKNIFIDPEEDSQGTRDFCGYADIFNLTSESIIDLIQIAPHKRRSMKWWYECYCYLAKDPWLSQQEHALFSGKHLIPIEGGSVTTVQKESGTVVTMPPTRGGLGIPVPACFSPSFVFINNTLARYLKSGDDLVQNWILSKFHVARFEASDLLPRAIRRIAPQIYSGAVNITRLELIEAWIFMKEMVQMARGIEYTLFWEDIGRFPVLIESNEQYSRKNKTRLIPAFLSYWPDSWLKSDNCLSGLRSLIRLDETLLEDLVSQSRNTRNDWYEFLSSAGVSSNPKQLNYSRMAASDDQLLCNPNAVSEYQVEKYLGERQSDMNHFIINELKVEKLWEGYISEIPRCAHNLPMVLRNLTLVAGFSQCVQKVEQEFTSGNSSWESRLWALIRQLPVSALSDFEPDTVFCRGGGGHSIDIGLYVKEQLQQLNWIPSSSGPTNSASCFIRSSGRHFISSGVFGDNLGDKLLPYVVVDNLADLLKLQNLGIELLEDAETASTTTLIKALMLLGNALSTNWGKQEILQSPGRWRLIRGAIQEAYRHLNQSQDDISFSNDTLFAVRSKQGVSFCSAPLYYADPGSAIEHAFIGVFPLLDVDRPYPNLFKQIPVIRLETSGEQMTVEESLVVEGRCKNAPEIRDEIISRLSPHILSILVAKTERQKDIDLIVRRLKERFEVKFANKLSINFKLIEDPSIQRIVQVPKYYLQRHIVPGPGAIEEARFVLYIIGQEPRSITALDADALGQAIAPIFFVDRTVEDISSIFPRIAYKYQQAQGNQQDIHDFLLNQLGVSLEAQEMAAALISGEYIDTSKIKAPPPVKIFSAGKKGAFVPAFGASGGKSMQSHQATLQQKAADFLNNITGQSQSKGRSSLHDDTVGKSTSTGLSASPVTPEQEERGKRGELEIKRRLQLPGGWTGFVLLEDRRQDGCGYDYLCSSEERKVELEVKTFTQNGQIVFTSTELQVAAISQGNYFLVGVLDDGHPEYEWKTYIMPNPISTLISEGEFDLQAKLYADAKDVFEFKK